ncbi:MAG: FlgD immunoglobulin-like domain containing protein [Bacteroidota bacterium]|nr:FlgD immunoglobulin-like domain containing protein [Bacteroidota bacterium]
MLRFYKIVAFSFLACILFFAQHSFAQQTESAEDEMLKLPVSVPHEVGVYRGINSIPESVRRTKPFARMLHDMQHYAGLDGVYDRQARVDAFEQSKSDILRDVITSDKVEGSKLPVFANAWTNVGPTNTGGCTKAMAFDPTDGNTIYAGGAAGGVWKTVNAGASWSPITDLVIPDLAVASIAVDPSNHNTIFVGSGDPSVAADGLPGTGLYKSTDGGSTWQHMAPTKLTGTVNKVLVHPTNSNIVFACSYDVNRGVYRSTDGGVTFARVFPAAKTADGVVWDVASAQLIGTKFLFYLVEGNQPGGGSTECGVYKSLDDGATWAKISAGGLPAGNNIGKSALAIPTLDKTKVYCLMANPNGDLANAGLYKSVNSGVLFTQVGTVPSTLFTGGNTGAQGWYDLYLAIAPHTATNDTLYIGGVEAYYSFNGGTSWFSYSDYNTHFQVHVDHQSIALDPTNTRKVYIGTDGGVYRSTDAGQTWSYRSNGMMTMRFYHIALDNNDFLKTYGGAQDQGIWRTITGQSPTQVLGGDGFQPIVTPTNSNIVYGEGPFGDLFKSTTGGGGNTYFSIDAPQFVQGNANFEPSDWETPFAMAPKNSATLFTGRQRMWQSVNSGSTWNPISPTFVYNNNTYFIESIGLSPANSQVYWAGLQGGKIQLTTNGGTNWTDKSTGTPGGTVRSIVCHPTDAAWALASFEVYGSSARVMRTTNSGASWTNVSGTTGKTLPGVPVNCVALDSISPSTVWYAATDNGIYYTRDAGSTWSIAGSGLGLAPCWDVQVHANKTTIRVGTHGRSIWEGNVNILPVELTGLTATKTSGGTKLDWKTDSERSNSGFKVERSFNYDPFEEIAFIPGAGNSNTEISYNYFDPKHDDGVYIYRLEQIDLDGSSHLSNIVEVHYGSSSALRLDQSFPNPFIASEAKTGSARIRYELPDADEVTMSIYSFSGTVVRTIIDHVLQQGGEQDAFWDGTDNNGVPVASGVYYYKLDTKSGGSLWNKMILIGR